jgi:hypothetical protein
MELIALGLFLLVVTLDLRRIPGVIKKLLAKRDDPRLKKYVLKETRNSDDLYAVWLWSPTTIYTDKTVYPNKKAYLEPDYKAVDCWAIRREGFFIGVVHEPITKIDWLLKMKLIDKENVDKFRQVQDQQTGKDSLKRR